jgi:glutamine synthetase
LRLVPHQEAPTRVCWSELNRSALIRVPLAWANVKNLASKVNPDIEKMDYEKTCRQTVELRSPDGSAFVHLLLAGITMSADWGFLNTKESLDIAKNSYVSVNIHDSDAHKELAELATSCVESSETLLQHRNRYEKDGIFPSQVIDYISGILQNENDKNLNKRLMALPEDEKLIESRRILHRDIHRH